MDKWLGIFESKVKEAGIKLHLITKYVDDVLIVCTNLQLGQFWEEGELHFCPEKAEEERKKGTSRSEVTYNALKSIENSINFVKFTGEYSEKNQPIPILDTEMWAGVPAPAKDRE